MNIPANEQRITKKGWLKKQGGVVKTWHRRWFVLNGDCLFYFAKDDDIKPLGNIFLPGNRVIEHPFNPSEPEKLLFEVLPAKGQTNKLAPNHDSYVMWSATMEERQQWVAVIRKVMFSSIGGAIFGQYLSETMAFEHGLDRDIPHIVEQCVAFLSEHGMEVEGIFRLPGRSAIIRDLKEEFDSGDKIVFDISRYDVHTVASLLKQYLRELPESVIPCQHYQKAMNIALRYQDSNDPSEVVELKRLIHLIPDDNYKLLKYLCEFIHQIGLKSYINKMTESNLATVFGPNFIRHMDDSPELFMATADLTYQLTYLLIHHNDELFADDDRKGMETSVVNDLVKLSSSGDYSDALSEPIVPMNVKRAARIFNNDLIGLDFHESVGSEDVFLEVEQSPTVELKPIIQEPSKEVSAYEMVATLDLDNVKITGKIAGNLEVTQLHQLSINSKVDSSLNSVGSSPDYDPMNNSELSTTSPGTSLSSANNSLSSPDYSLSAKPIPPKRRSKRKGITLPRQSVSPTPVIEAMNKAQTIDRSTSCIVQSLQELVKPALNRMPSLPVHKAEDATSIVHSEILELKQSLSESQVQVGELKGDLAHAKTRYEGQVKNLKSELQNVKGRYETYIKSIEVLYQTQITDLLSKVDVERRSRDEALEKIVLLQKQLHHYQMQYGELVRPVSEGSFS